MSENVYEQEKEVMAQFHGEDWTEEDSVSAIGNVGIMWLEMAESTSIPMEGVLDATRVIQEAGLSEDFEQVFGAVVETCGLLIDNTNPAKVMAFIYGIHCAGVAALDTYDAMRKVLSYREEFEEEE